MQKRQREEDDAKVVRIESCDSKKYFTYDSLTRDCVLLISLEGFSTPFLKVSEMIILICETCCIDFLASNSKPLCTPKYNI